MSKEFFEHLLDDIGNTLREDYDIEPCKDNSNIDLGVLAARAMCVLTGKDDILYWDVVHEAIQDYLEENEEITSIKRNKNYEVSIVVEARYHITVKASSPKEAREKAEIIFEEVDVGELECVDWFVQHTEGDDGSWTNFT